MVRDEFALVNDGCLDALEHSWSRAHLSPTRALAHVLERFLALCVARRRAAPRRRAAALPKPRACRR